VSLLVNQVLSDLAIRSFQRDDVHALSVTVPQLPTLKLNKRWQFTGAHMS